MPANYFFTVFNPCIITKKEIIMQIQKTNSQVDFKGTSEILYNLGKAVENSQDVALGVLLPEGPIAHARMLRHSGSVHAYLDSATQDNEFKAFLDTFESHIETPIEGINRFGSVDYPTLKEMPSLTKEYNTETFVDNTVIKYVGFNFFQKMFTNVMKDNYGAEGTNKIAKLLDALRPKSAD